MRICMCRVDDRLVHGQITTVWARRLGISSIFLVDDALSGDRLAARVLCMAAPPRVEVHVLSVDQTAAALRSGAVRSAQLQAMLLLRNLASARDLLAQTGRIFETLCLGGMPPRVGRSQVGKNLFFSREERALALELIDRYGISIVSQMLPSDPPVDVGAVLRDQNK